MTIRVLSVIAISVLVFPLCALLLLSVVQQWAYPQLWNSIFTEDNWLLAISGSHGLMGSLVKSILFSSLIAMLCTATGFIVSRYISYHPRKQLLLSLAYYPYVIAPVVLGIMLQYYFIKLSIAGTWAGVFAAQLLFVFPYGILLFSGFWTAQVKATEGQAFTLGASPCQTLRWVLIPSAKEWVFVCYFQCFLISWFEYGITQLIGVGHIDTLTIRVMQFVREANPYLAAVASCLMIAPPLLLLAINRKAFLAR